MTLHPRHSIELGQPGIRPFDADDIFVRPGSGGEFEAAMDDWPAGQSVVALNTTLLAELAPLDAIRTWLVNCPGTFAKDMAYGLIEASVLSYDHRDWDRLAEAIVSWGATLQIEADRPLARRLRRQLQESGHDTRA